MIIQYCFPVRAQLVVDETWPLSLGKYRLECVTRDDGTVIELVVQTQTADPSAFPSLKPSTTPGVTTAIDLGSLPDIDEIEQLVRTCEGILNLFRPLEVDFEHFVTKWIPENDDEHSRIPLQSFGSSSQKIRVDIPQPLQFEIMARAAACSTEAIEYELPLSFLRKANNELSNDRYIEAYYNFFFFLETQFAPGLSRPHRVAARLKASQAVQDGINQSRVALSQPSRHPVSRQLVGYLRLSNDEIIEKLVSLRGTLHHHALTRMNTWHPAKQSEFKPDALLLGKVCHAVALNSAMPLLFDEKRERQLMTDAQRAGSVVALRFQVTTTAASGARTLTLRLPGRRLTRRNLAAADATFRNFLDNVLRRANTLSYRVFSEDGAVAYAEYTREIPDTRQS